MVTQVTLGNFFTANGKTVLGGVGGSGLDTNSLIASLTTAKALPATNEQDLIKVNDKQGTAYNTLQSLLSTFQTASDALRNPPGVNNAANNVFKFTTGSVSSNTAIPGSVYVNVDTTPGAALQSYAIRNINSLATAAKQTSGTFTVVSADASVVPPAAGTVQFNAGTITIKGQNIAVASGDSLNTIAAKFNAASNTTGLVATVIQVSAGHYQMSFASTATGTDNNFDLSNQNETSVTDPSGVLSSMGLTGATTQQSSIFTVNSADDLVVPPASGSVQFAPGTITIQGQNITIDGTDTLNTIAGKFQSVANITGITANVVNVGVGQYKLNFTAALPGSGNNFDLTNIGTVSDPSSILSGIGLAAPVKGATTAHTGTNASFSINGIAVTRRSNSVSDLINGVTFNLLQQTPDPSTELTVSVTANTSTAQNSIINFVNAYNALKKFEAQQTQLNSNGTYASTAVLANSSTFRSVMSNINSQITSAVSGISSSIHSLADIGITFVNQPSTSTDPEVDNILNVDDGQLTTALANNFDAVNKLFGFTLSSDNANIKIFSRNNSIAVSNFTLNIDPSTNTFQASYTDNNGDPQTVNMTAVASASGTGYTLTGQGALSGLVLIYGSNADTTAHLSMTQGIADKLYNTSDAAVAANTGTLAVELQSLKDNDSKLNDDISRINDQVDQYRTQLLAKFSALEQAISQVNTLLQSLNANQNAALISSGH